MGLPLVLDCIAESIHCTPKSESGLSVKAIGEKFGDWRLPCPILSSSILLEAGVTYFNVRVML